MPTFVGQLRGIILTDRQLLCLWKLVLFVHDLELLVLAWRATSLTRYSLPSDILTSPAFAATFLTRQGILRYFLFWHKSLNWWSLWYSVYGFLVSSYAFSLFRSRVQGLLRICWFLLAIFQTFFSKWNNFLLLVLCTCPQIYCKQVFALVFWRSVCFISCTLTVLKHFYFKEHNLHCKPSLLPVLNNIKCISCRDCFALIFLPVLMLLIWSVITPYNNCFSSCVSALI